MEPTPRPEQARSPEPIGDQASERADGTLLALRILRQWDQMHARVRQVEHEVYPRHRYSDEEWLDKIEEARGWTDPMVEMNAEWATFCREITGISPGEWERAERLRERERDRERRRDASPPAA